jgi:cobalt-zinc-cadmium resistance protein CzcA
MKNLILTLVRYRSLVVLALVAWLAGGTYIFLKLDIEAYPDPSPPLVEVITQNPSWSAEEMERQVTVPLETVLSGTPKVEYVRSITIFGLSDVKLYFSYDSDYFRDRQEVLNRVQLATLPANVSPQLSPWSPTGEIYRYRLVGNGYSLNDLKATQDWMVSREIKRVPGIIDVTTFGGTTKQYQAEVDPAKLLQFNVTLPQVLAAIGASNANVGGNYLTLGSQSVNIRGLGLLRTIDEMGSVVVAENKNVPVLLRDVAIVHEGFQPRLGQVGVNKDDDAIEATVLLNRGEQSLPALAALHDQIKMLNNGRVPHGMQLVPLYDRTDLIDMTTHTVRHLVLLGIILIVAILLAFLGDVPISLIAALTIPAALLCAFALMVLTDRSANLISIGAIDFGILVDAAVIVLESVHRKLAGRSPETSVAEAIAEATAEASKPVIFSVLVIITALIPLFTMEGVPGKIFAPMSITYVFALTGALIFSLFFAPVLTSWKTAPPAPEIGTAPVRWMHRRYERVLDWSLRYRAIVLVIGILVFAGAIAIFPLLGGEFMPQLEEGNLWVRATLPQDVSFETATGMANEIRRILLTYPEVTQVVSQTGRPDDGTDVTTFNNIEFMVSLKVPDEWPKGTTKDKLIEQMNAQLGKFPGVDFNFSQNIQDNVEEAMSGVKGENSLKLFGDDIDVLATKAAEIQNLMSKVPGVADLGVFKETGQPQLMVSIDRAASARYGLTPNDVNTAVSAAIGGQAATQILEGDRRFDFVVRYLPQFRQTPEAIRNILLASPDGNRVPLGEVAQVTVRDGAFMIYRENGRRYIPIKFSVRGRDLAGTVAEMQQRLAKSISLPEGYNFEWAGEYDSLQKEERRLAIVIPVSLLIVLALLFAAFRSWTDALLVLAILPFGLSGGLFSLLITRTPFSISAAVGFASVIGVCTLGCVVMLSGIRRMVEQGRKDGEAVRAGALDEMRAVAMACAAAGLGLLPAALSSGIGVQAQQPLARVVVGGMVTSVFAILLLLPVMTSLFLGRAVKSEE